MLRCNVSLDNGYSAESARAINIVQKILSTMLYHAYLISNFYFFNMFHVFTEAFHPKIFTQG